MVSPCTTLPQLVHHIVEELMVTLVARADSNTGGHHEQPTCHLPPATCYPPVFMSPTCHPPVPGHLGSLVERMKPLLQDLSRTVVEP